MSWKRFWHHVGLHRRWLTRAHRDYQPVFVIATGRSGSNLLLSYLNEQPGMSVRPEILHPRLYYGIWPHQAHPAGAIRHIRRSLHADRTPVRGCKLMLNQLAECRLTIDDVDAAFPSAKYIVLYRQHLGEQFVSNLVARATRQFILHPGQEARSARVQVDAEEFKSFAAGLQIAYRDVLSRPWLAARSVLLSYEELVQQPGYWLRHQIGPLLGVKIVAVASSLRKQNSQALSQTVTNYAEVSRLLATTRQTHTWPRAKAA